MKTDTRSRPTSYSGLVLKSTRSYVRPKGKKRGVSLLPLIYRCTLWEVSPLSINQSWMKHDETGHRNRPITGQAWQLLEGPILRNIHRSTVPQVRYDWTRQWRLYESVSTRLVKRYVDP